LHQQTAAQFAWLRRLNYPGEWLRADVVAGLTTAAVVAPKCMAYAVIAGLPAQAAFYSAFAPMLAYALLGSSRVLSVSTTSTIALLTATALSQAARTAGPTELLTAAATLSGLVGVMLLLAGALRLGFIASFISDPVLTGFKAGIAVLIVVDQLPKLLGVHIAKEGFLRDLASLAQLIPEASTPTVVLALATLAMLFALERYAPRTPAPLIAVVLGVAASVFFDFGGRGIETVGAIPARLPSLHLPDTALVSALWPAALGIALMSFTESIATGRALAAAGEPRPSANRELIALGVANGVGGLTGAMASGGGASQTAVNARAGAKTQMASVVTASVILAVLVALAPLLASLPLATLAAVVVVTTLGLIAPQEFRAIGVLRRTELYWALAAFVGVALFGSLNGILIAVVISVLTLIYHANHPPVYVLARKPGSNVFRPLTIDHPLDETFPGLLILRTEGRMHFANAQRVGDKMWPLINDAKPKVVLLDCSAVPDIEYTALRMLTEAEEKLRESGIVLWLAALNPEALHVLEKASLGKSLGRERMFFNVEQAVGQWAVIEATRCAKQGDDSLLHANIR
jgi:SulP family sulfate permease